MFLIDKNNHKYETKEILRDVVKSICCLEKSLRYLVENLDKPMNENTYLCLKETGEAVNRLRRIDV